MKERQYPLTVISIAVYGEYEIRDIQQNSAWTVNPYPGVYALVPDEMVEDILATEGFCHIVLTEDGKTVASFTPRDIPFLPEPEPPVPQPTNAELMAAINALGDTDELQTYYSMTQGILTGGES